MPVLSPPDLYAESASFVMPTGQYAGKTIDRIAGTDSGLLYLDWLRGEIEKEDRQGRLAQNATKRRVLEHLSVYLEDPVIAGDLRRLVKGGG